MFFTADTDECSAVKKFVVIKMKVNVEERKKIIMPKCICGDDANRTHEKGRKKECNTFLCSLGCIRRALVLVPSGGEKP